MTSSASTLAKVELQGAGDNPGTWHSILNDLEQQHEEDYRGATSISLSNADVTLTDTQYVSNQARRLFINISGTATGSHAIIAPDRSQYYVIDMQGNPNGNTITFKASGGTGFTLTRYYRYIVKMDGSGRAQIIMTDPPQSVALTGTGTYTGNFAQTPTAFHNGFTAFVDFASANTTSPVTVAFNAQSAITVKKNGSMDLVVSDISAGMKGILVHDGTNLQLFSAKVPAALGLADGGDKTSGFTAAVNTRYTVNFSADGTITFPASATAGDIIVIAIGTIYTHTLNPNGLKINQSTSNLLLPNAPETYTLIYTGATNGWA